MVCKGQRIVEEGDRMIGECIELAVGERRWRREPVEVLVSRVVCRVPSHALFRVF